MEDGTPYPEPKREVSEEKLKMFLSKLGLSGIADWPNEEQQEVRKLLAEHINLFALNDLDLGKTSVVKHHIKLTGYTPFKERYHHIPLCQFEEVRNHLQEMVALVAIKSSQSPWASALVVVRKKNGSLRFCIDLRKLNAHTVKNAYSLPRIDETLDFLNGSKMFPAWILKATIGRLNWMKKSNP